MTDDDLVVMASEAGVLPIPEERIVQKWRLQPGKMFLIDLDQGRIIDDSELKDTLSRTKPYQDWLSRINIKLDELPVPNSVPVSSCSASLLDRQQAFGYSQEDLKFILEPMAASGEEATGSMGIDSPLAVLSNKTKPLFNYFRQLFAQVTNPPIDRIREQLVMSLVSFIGPKPNLLGINEINPPYRLEVAQPVLDFDNMAKLRRIATFTGNKFHSSELDICYPLVWGNEGVEARLASLCAEAELDWRELSDTDDMNAAKRLAFVQICAISRPKDSVQMGFLLPYQYNLQDKKYPLCRDLYVMSRSGRDDVGLGFASFIAGEIGQKVILKAGLLPKYQSERAIELKDRGVRVVE